MPAAVLPRRTTPAVLVVLLVAMLGTLLAPSSARAASDGGAEAAFVAAVNAERAAAGLPALVVAGDLVEVARGHSVRMADAVDLHHNDALPDDVSGWQRVGENVGRGPAVEVVHAAFMQSPSHRANVLDPTWTEVGVGVEARDGRLWVTQVFRLPAADEVGVASASAPTPVVADSQAPDAAGPAATPGVDRALVMLTRMAGTDAALDAAG